MVLKGQVCPCCGRRLPETAEEKVTRLVDRTRGPEACWPYTGRRNPLGYGIVDVFERGTARQYRAHRVAYEMAHGPIPEGLVLLHGCDNPRCCNPAHLTPGTHGENIADMWAKGRQQKYDRQVHGEEHSQARLDSALVLELRRRFAAGETGLALAAEYGVTQATAWKAIHGITWAHLPGAAVKRGQGVGARRKRDQSGERNARSVLTDEEAAEIRRQAAGGMAQSQIAPIFGISQSQVSRIITGKRRSAHVD